MSYRYIGGNRGLVELKNGLHLAVPVRDPFIGCPIAIRGEWEPTLESVIRATVRPGARCINVGANIGYFTTLLASLAGPDGHVFAFEPNPQNVDLLVFNLYLNGLNSIVHVYRAAVSNKSGTARFVMSEHYSDGWIVPGDIQEITERPRFNEHGLLAWKGATYRDAVIQEVPVVTLDHILESSGSFDLLLCDAEGFDINVLLGARHLINRSRDRLTIIFEWNPDFFYSHSSHTALTTLFVMLSAAGYQTAYCLTKNWTSTDSAPWVSFQYESDGLPKANCNIICCPAGLDPALH